jgi:hypothetical protein
VFSERRIAVARTVTCDCSVTNIQSSDKINGMQREDLSTILNILQEREILEFIVGIVVLWVGYIKTMSKVFKVQTIPKSVESMGSVETEIETFSEEWLKIDTFKDWLERVPGDLYKARCSVCNIVLDCSISQLSKHASCSGHQTAIQNSRKRKAVIGQLIGKVMLYLGVGVFCREGL